MARFNAERFFQEAWQKGVRPPVSDFAASVKLIADRRLWEPAFLASATLVEVFHLRLLFGLFRKLRHNPEYIWAVLLATSLDVDDLSQVLEDKLGEPYIGWLSKTCGREDVAEAFTAWRDGTRVMRNKLMHAGHTFSSEVLCKAAMANVSYMQLCNEIVAKEKGFAPAGDLRAGLPRGRHRTSEQLELEFRRLGLVRGRKAFPPQPKAIALSNLKPLLEKAIRSACMRT